MKPKQEQIDETDNIFSEDDGLDDMLLDNGTSD
jgi:hypothetical protein